jgi:hypothetical protein
MTPWPQINADRPRITRIDTKKYVRVNSCNSWPKKSSVKVYVTGRSVTLLKPINEVLYYESF